MIRASECVPATSTQTVNGFGANTATSKTIVTNPTADSAINPASEAKNAPIDTTIGELDKNKTTETNATAAPTTTEEVTVEIPSQNSAPKKSKKNKKNKK